MNKELDFKKSRSGRLLIPRLKTWTGERVVVSKEGCIEIQHGGPDCTSTFETERTLFQNSNSLSRSLHYYKSPEQKTPQKLAQSFNLGSKVLSNQPSEKEKLKGKNNNVRSLNVSLKKNVRQGRNPRKSANEPIVDNPSRKQNRGLQQREANKINKTRTPSPKKNLRKLHLPEQNREIDINGPAFQPFVRLVRLLPQEILSLTIKKPSHNRSPNRKQNKTPETASMEEQSKQKPSPHQKTPVSRSRGLLQRRIPRTVKETQQILRVLNQSNAREELEDEAASTAAFFQNTPCRAVNSQVNEAIGLLNCDFGSDDNLSIRSMSERESSPMSTAISPIGSVYETDAEMSGWEDGLLMGSPSLGDATSFQRAKVLHKMMKDKSTLLRMATSRKKENLPSSSSQHTSTSATTVTSSTSSCQMLQPQAFRALEKDLKKKVKNCQQWDFSTYYNGNRLQISVNSDTDSDESSVDSLDEF